MEQVTPLHRDIWLFDVDGTLVDSFDAEHLRPLVVDLFTEIRAAGAAIAVWSAGGAEHARRVIDRHGLAAHVERCHDKPPGVDGRWVLHPWMCLERTRVICVDDQPERLPAVHHVIGVFPYLRPDAHDRALAPALALARSTSGGA
ncbi:MAG: HAD family hydrolase [Acidimicrobiales bacterium]